MELGRVRSGSGSWQLREPPPREQATAPLGKQTKGIILAAGCLASAFAMTAGCQNKAPETEATLRSLSGSSVDADRVLGFEAESVSDWSIIESGPGTLVVSTTASEGMRSLGVKAHGFVPVQSVALPSLGDRVSNLVRYDIMLPAQLSQTSPWWYGASQFYVEIPSLGLYKRYIGQVELTPMPLGVWNTVTFSLPEEVVTKLRGTYSDLRLTIVVNAPWNATQPYLLDNLRFTPYDEPPSVAPPRPEVRIPLTTTPGPLPQGGKGFYPAYDGDSFHFVFPTQPAPTPTSDEVFAQYVWPTLQAMGYPGAQNTIVATSTQGIPDVPVSLGGMSQLVDKELNNGFPRSPAGLPSDCTDATITATRTYEPPASQDGTLLPQNDSTFVSLPASIQVTSGSPGTGTATFSVFVPCTEPPAPPEPPSLPEPPSPPPPPVILLECTASIEFTYVGDGNSSYNFSGCTSGCDETEYSPGDAFFAKKVVLHIESGDSSAGPTVVEFANDCGATAPGSASRAAVDAMLGISAPAPLVDEAFKAANDMDFAQYKAFIERQGRTYYFNQVVDNTMVDFAGLQAYAWNGAGVDTVSGTVIHHGVKKNSIKISASNAPSLAATALATYLGPNATVPSSTPLDGVQLVLLPYGASSDGKTNLRYAYRMKFRFTWKQPGMTATATVWLDAETGKLLQLDHSYRTAIGPTLRRDPLSGADPLDMNTKFTVDGYSSSLHGWVLKRSDRANRIDYQADGYNATDTFLPCSGFFCSGIDPNFSQMSGIGDLNQALCPSRTNKNLVQVNLMATLDRQVDIMRALGIFPPYPATPWDPTILNTAAGCQANAGMNFGVCPGDLDPNCPGAPGLSSGLALDNTVVSHEHGHNVTQRLSEGRPVGYCCPNGVCAAGRTCPLPKGWGHFEDLADVWADHFESSNCVGGYASRTVDVAGTVLHRCEVHNEFGGLPRLHDLPLPFDPNNPKDHFPEHRRISPTDFRSNIDPHANQEMAAAMLWQARAGFRSLNWAGGVNSFATVLTRGIRKSGFWLNSVSNTSLDQYIQLASLEGSLLWALRSESVYQHPIVQFDHSASKVLAGFARGGIFLVPYQCIDGDPSTKDANACPDADTGADAVIDLDDNVSADDFDYLGVTVVENDYVSRSGPSPTFRVWTGPRYRFQGTAVLPNSPSCNPRFRIEISNSPDFPWGPNKTKDSDWLNATDCYGTWTPPAGAISDLTPASGGLWLWNLFKRTKLYYRARTSNMSGGDIRVSTSPASGVYVINTPYFVVNFIGTPIL